MSFDDLPLSVQFPELNTFQISKIRELMKREYERGRNDRLELIMQDVKGSTFTISEPTPMNYTPNTGDKK